MNILSVNGNNLSVNWNLLGVNSDLLPYTIRLKYSQGTTPTFSKGTGTLVDAQQNIWDLTYQNNNWSYLLENHGALLEVLGGNTTNITNMFQMFNNCRTLTQVALFDTSNVTNMQSMFYGCVSLVQVPLFNTTNVSNMFQILYGCQSLTSLPLFDTSNVTNMNVAFADCYKVQSGALALYQQASTQATPPTSHLQTFRYCGRDTETGSDELEQIPSDWK